MPKWAGPHRPKGPARAITALRRGLRSTERQRKPRNRRGFEFRDQTHPEEGDETSRQPDSIPKRETRNEKMLRNAAIAFSYRHYVAAYPPGRVHRAVPPNQNR